MIDLGVWASDQQSFEFNMRLFGLLRKIKFDETVALLPVDGLAISGAFKITKEHAVFGPMSEEGEIEIISPAVLVEGLFWNLRLSGALGEQIIKDIDTGDPIEQENAEGELLPVFDRTNLKQILKRRDRTHEVNQGRADDEKRPAAFANKASTFEIYDTVDIATPHNVFA